MKITLCGSIAFIDEMEETRKKFESMGHKVKLPPLIVVGEGGKMISAKEYHTIRHTADASEKWVWERKAEAIREHFDKVMWADVILVLNYDKNNISYYIGANTLLEMGWAFHLKKPMYLLNPIPEISYKEEILGMQPIIINRNLTLIQW